MWPAPLTSSWGRVLPQWHHPISGLKGNWKNQWLSIERRRRRRRRLLVQKRWCNNGSQQPSDQSATSKLWHQSLQNNEFNNRRVTGYLTVFHFQIQLKWLLSWIRLNTGNTCMCSIVLHSTKMILVLFKKKHNHQSLSSTQTDRLQPVWYQLNVTIVTVSEQSIKDVLPF